VFVPGYGPRRPQRRRGHGRAGRRRAALTAALICDAGTLLAARDYLLAGLYRAEPPTGAGLARCRELQARHADLALGVAVQEAAGP